MKKLKRLNIPVDEARTKDLGNGVVEVVVSTNSLDRHNERLSIKGLDIKNYNGVVLLNHDYFNLPVGRSILLKKKSDAGKEMLISRTEFAIDQYDLAKTVYKLVKDGFMPDVSIGFIPKEWDEESKTWTKAEMIEYSHVTVGANRDAKVTQKALENIDMTEDEFEDEIVDFVNKSMDDTKTDKVEKTKEEKQLEKDSEAIKTTASALSSTLLAYTEASRSEKPRHKRIVLVSKARKQAQSLDRMVECLITDLRQKYELKK